MPEITSALIPQVPASLAWQLPIGLPVRVFQSQCMTWDREGLVNTLPPLMSASPALRAILFSTGCCCLTAIRSFLYIV